MSVDLRRFIYDLEPLRSRRKWQLDSLLAQLGRIQSAILRTEENLVVLQERHLAMSQELTRALAAGVNPIQHNMGLQWLVNLKSGIHSEQQALITLTNERSEVRALCQKHQHKVEVLDSHRDECVMDFIQEESRHQALEADRDWIARLRPEDGQDPLRGRRKLKFLRRNGNLEK